MKKLKDFYSYWHPEFVSSLKPASKSQVLELESMVDVILPDNYKEFLLTMGGGIHNELILWKFNRLERDFAINSVLEKLKRNPYTSKVYIRIGIEWNTESDIFLNTITGEIHNGFVENSSKIDNISPMRYCSLEHMLFTYVLNLVMWKNMRHSTGLINPYTLHKKHTNTRHQHSLIIKEAIFKVAKSNKIEKVPYTTNRYNLREYTTQGFISKTSAMYFTPQGFVNISSESKKELNTMIKKLTENTALIPNKQNQLCYIF